jgi:hypothetical protein
MVSSGLIVMTTVRYCKGFISVSCLFLMSYVARWFGSGLVVIPNQVLNLNFGISILGLKNLGCKVSPYIKCMRRLAV